jgi:hypothetical protein
MCLHARGAVAPGDNFRMAKINRSKSAWTEISAQALYNQAVWTVNFGITGPICARALNLKIPLKLGERGHHGWPVKRRIRKLSTRRTTALFVIERNPLRGQAEPWYDLTEQLLCRTLRRYPVLHTKYGIELTTDLLQCNETHKAIVLPNP